MDGQRLSEDYDLDQDGNECFGFDSYILNRFIWTRRCFDTAGAIWIVVCRKLKET